MSRRVMLIRKVLQQENGCLNRVYISNGGTSMPHIWMPGKRRCQDNHMSDSDMKEIGAASFKEQAPS